MVPHDLLISDGLVAVIDPAESEVGGQQKRVVGKEGRE